MRHYTITSAERGNGMQILRENFPDGIADYLNVVLFSTSGVHGTYTTIEDVEREADKSDDDESKSTDVTFLIIRPRVVEMIYGNAKPKTPDDFEFLKRLRSTSHAELAQIGIDEP